MKDKAQIKVTYSIKIGPYDMRLNKEEALELYNILKKELGIADTYYPPMQPYIPSNPLPIQPYSPTIPDYPRPYEIWCQQPSSTCNS